MSNQKDRSSIHVLNAGNSDARSAFIDAHDTFLFDCDGVIWIGNTLIPGVKQVLEELKSKGKRLLFVTNNSSKSRRMYQKKFQSLGLNVTEDEVFGSSYAAAYYIANKLNLPKDKKVYAIGMEGVREELTNQGIPFCGINEDDENIADFNDLEHILPDPSIGAVLMGIDLHLNYKKVAKAFTYLHSNPDCHFLATNTDRTYPTHGRLFPGTGSFISVLSTALEREPVVLGKPSATMLDVIVDKYHLNRGRTCMVGDRLDTDIAFGHMGGVTTLLVMTGVTTEEVLSNSTIIPDYKIDSLGSLI